MKDRNATVIVDLTPSEKKIWKGLHKDARWGVRKAEQSGLVVHESDSDDDWKKFHEIFLNVAVEGGSDKQPLEEIRRASHVLLVCKKEGIVIGGATIFFHPIYNIAVPRLYKVASQSDYLSYQPNNLLYWSAILWAKQQGYTSFDLGGWQIRAKGHLEGVNTFKERWGDVVFHESEYPFYQAWGRKLIRNNLFIRKLYNRVRGRKII